MLSEPSPAARTASRSTLRFGSPKQAQGPSTPPTDSQANQPAALRMTFLEILLRKLKIFFGFDAADIDFRSFADS